MAIDAFLKIPTIPGESQSPTHPGEIELQSWSWGGNQPLTPNAPLTAGKLKMDNLNLVLTVDSSTPKLFAALAIGQGLGTVTLSLTRVRGGSQKPFDYLTLTLTRVQVASVELAQNDDSVLVNVALAYATYSITYVQQKPDGSLLPPATTGWDLVANKSI